MSDKSKFSIDKNQVPDPASVPNVSNQPSGMPSDSEVHKMARDEDMGKV